MRPPVSIVVGLVSAALYLHSQVDIAFRIPGVAYWTTVLGGLAASLAIVATTFPLVNRMTDPKSPETTESSGPPLRCGGPKVARPPCSSQTVREQKGQAAVSAVSTVI
jgi:hypothetical protein